jgi:hypothetical protein
MIAPELRTQNPEPYPSSLISHPSSNVLNSILIKLFGIDKVGNGYERAYFFCNAANSSRSLL